MSSPEVNRVLRKKAAQRLLPQAMCLRMKTNLDESVLI
jgi:hypothetical protein